MTEWIQILIPPVSVLEEQLLQEHDAGRYLFFNDWEGSAMAATIGNWITGIPHSRTIKNHDSRSDLKAVNGHAWSTAKDNFMMKVFLLGLLVAGAGETTAAAVSDDADFKQFAWIIAGAVGGVVIGVCALKPKDIRMMGFDIVGNFFCALMFSPVFIPWFAARFGVETPNFRWHLFGSTILGLVGLAIVRSCQPEFLNWLRKQMGLPAPEKATSTPPSTA